MDLEILRTICLSYPGATEEMQWGNHLLFKVGGKMFCIADLDDEGVAVKVAEDDFEACCAGHQFIPAPHLARAKWVKSAPHARIKRSDWETMIEASYALIKAKLPKKIQSSLRP